MGFAVIIDPDEDGKQAMLVFVSSAKTASEASVIADGLYEMSADRHMEVPGSRRLRAFEIPDGSFDISLTGRLFVAS